MMLSPSFNIEEFMNKVRNCSPQETILIMDKEATEAERYYYKRCPETQGIEAVSYARYLKDFVLYIRHGVLTRTIRKLNMDSYPKI